MTLVSFWTLLSVTLVVSGLGPVVVMYLWREYGPSSSSDMAFSKLANVPRRHLERRREWLDRCSAAYDVRDKANDAFVAAAEYRQTSHRGGVYTLSVRHPASLALLAAQYPDGPPLSKLFEIGGVVPVEEREETAVAS